MDQNTHNVSGDSEVMLSFFGCSKFSVWVCNTSDVHTRQTFAINWSKIQLSWVLMLYYTYKTVFSAYKTVIGSPCACDLFVSKLTKITRYMDVRFGRGATSVQWSDVEHALCTFSGVCWDYFQVFRRFGCAKWKYCEKWHLPALKMMMMSWCLMSSDVIWHIRDKLWPMPKHGSIKSTYVRCMRV